MNSKIRIIKSTTEMNLPNGIADVKLFREIVQLYNDDRLTAKKLSLKELIDQDKEI